MEPSSSGWVDRPLPPTPAPRTASATLRNLSKLVSKITVEDINGAKRCGGGGFGDVYVLTHPAIGKLALKRVRTSGSQQQIDAQLRRSAREAETWRQLAHPNVLPFLDVLERSGGVYLVSPFVPNGSINDFARRHPDIDRVRLIQDAAAGIVYLHQCGIVHGDIKGANILVSDDIRALLCDFGLARPQEINTSTDMQGLGTVRWQSPELLQSGAGKTFKSDVWAFAMTIFEVLSGNIPYHQYDLNTAVIIAVMMRKERPPKEPATSLNGVSYASLWDIAGDCWNEDPDLRPDMQEAHDRLILGGFRSLLLSPSPGSDEDTPSDAQIIPPSPIPSPSPGYATPARPGHDQLHIGPVPLAISSDVAESVSDDDEPTMKAPLHRVQPTENIMVAPVERVGVTMNSVLRGHSGAVNCLAFSPDGRILASGSSDHTLRFWDIPSGGRRGEKLEGHAGVVSCLAFSPDGTLVASGSRDNTLRLWDVQAEIQSSDELVGHTGWIWCLAFSPDSRTVASGSSDATLRLWDVESGSDGCKVLKDHTSTVMCLAFSPDGTTIAYGSLDGTLRFWDVQSGGKRGTALEGHTKYVYCLAFSPDGRIVASGSHDNTIRFWDVQSGRQWGRALLGHTDSIFCVAFSPDSTLIASGSCDNTVRLWDVQSGSQRVRVLQGHADVVYCLAFSPDSRTVASGSCDSTVRLWDVRTGSQRGKTLEGHTGAVVCLKFSPDGNTVASGSRDHTLRLWNPHS